MRALDPLREPNFRLLWTGQAVSAAGDSLSGVAFTFATLSLNGSASALGLVLALNTVARVVSLPLGGVWADRLPRQVVMLGADWARAALNGLLATLLVTHVANLEELIACSVAFSFASGFFVPASTSLVPQTVSAERLQQANALIGLSRSATSVAGPFVAGVLVALINPGWVIAIDAVTFVFSAISLALMRIPRTAQATERKGFWHELAEGMHAVTRRRWYLINICMHAVWNFAIAAFFVLGPIVAKRELGGPSAWGFISASLGVGAILGGLAALRVTPRRPLVVANAVLIFAAFQTLSLAPPLPLPFVIAGCVLGWAGLTFLNEVWFGTVPQLMPPEVLARATSFDWLLSMIAMPAGFAVFGPLADRVGIATSLVIASVLLASTVLVVLVPGVRSVRRTPDGKIVVEAATS